MLSVQKIDLINEGKFITLNIKNKTPFNIKLKKLTNTEFSFNMNNRDLTFDRVILINKVEGFISNLKLKSSQWILDETKQVIAGSVYRTMDNICKTYTKLGMESKISLSDKDKALLLKLINNKSNFNEEFLDSKAIQSSIRPIISMDENFSEKIKKFLDDCELMDHSNRNEIKNYIEEIICEDIFNYFSEAIHAAPLYNIDMKTKKNLEAIFPIKFDEYKIDFNKLKQVTTEITKYFLDNNFHKIVRREKKESIINRKEKLNNIEIPFKDTSEQTHL
ncbi:TPA: hypothetical protein ACS705_000152 [Providencia alcalifaciens]|uniref:hypothetical protein n=1 Tax=Providencia alcalifaciens TaxID=126385 RepID=UPI0012B5D7DF|nr:hypothetical protein [Providencia alcalifaciens]MTC32592.1 hypothetical protein [Providencia alcalifaciens]